MAVKDSDHDLLITIDERLSNLIVKFDEFTENQKAHDDKVDCRITKVEKDTAAVTSKVAVVCSLLAMGLTTFLNSIFGVRL